MSYPNMSAEIMEAIYYWFKEWPDVRADCYVYLSHINEMSYDLASKASIELDKMGRCLECGSVLEVHSYKEPHPELGAGIYEFMNDVYCPKCNLGGEV